MRLKHLFSKHSINYLLSSSRFINGRASSFHTTKLSGTTDCIFSNTSDGIGATLSKHSTLHLLCPSSSHLVFSNNTRTIHSYESETTTSGFDDGKKPFEAYGSSDNVTNELVVESTCAISNEFLSRFCWVMRGKMFEVFKEWHKKTMIYDSLLAFFLIAMSRLERKYLDRIIASVMVTPSPDIYAHNWRMLTEVCNACIVEYARYRDCTVMSEFAYAVGMDRETLMDFHREFDSRNFPQNKFYSELENIRGNGQTRKAAETYHVDSEEEGHVSLPMIEGYIKAGKLERAEVAFESFLSLKLLPDIKIINDMMRAYVRAEYPELRESLLKEMESRHIQLAENIQLTENIYMVLLRSFARRGDVEAANRISRAMESAGFLSATKISRAMESAGIQPTPETCKLLIEAYGKADEVDRAREHFDRISELGYKPDRSAIIKMLLAYQKCSICWSGEEEEFLKQFPIYY